MQVPAAPKQPAAPDEIAAKKSARVRTLVKYGMTISQVAQLYRVPVETIASILRRA
jgi:hypothetical protein